MDSAEKMQIDGSVVNANDVVKQDGDLTGNIPMRYALQVTGVNGSGVKTTPTAWNVVLEGSLDGKSYTVLLTHSNTAPNANGDTVWGGGNFSPARFLRVRLVSVTLNTATKLVVRAIGV